MKNNARVAAAIWVLGAMGMAAHAGCGGRVIVDGLQGEGGAGQGQGSNGQGNNGQGNNGQSGSGLACGASPVPSSLTFCGGSAVGATGGPTSCVTSLCDPPGNQFEADCQSNACICKINGVVMCTCALNGLGDFCGGTSPCCPWNQ